MRILLAKIAATFSALLLTGVVLSAQPPTFSLLHGFTGSPDGAVPAASLTMDAAGNFYGTTAFGGINCNGGSGCGTIFKIDAAGNETVLHAFTGSDGETPAGGLLLDAAGNLFGTTVNGGGAGFCRNFGCGTVFKLDPSGNLTVLHAFSGGADGANPTAGLIMDSSGNLYGTAGFGGNGGIGVVFKIDTSNNLTTLHSFDLFNDGAEPSAPLIMDAAGNVYSTTFRGGRLPSGTLAFGTVFKLNLSTLAFSTLHTFTNGSDGGSPAAPVIMDPAGNLYGTTDGGGSGGAGVVFKLDTTNTLTVLHAFTGGADGGNVVIEGLPAAGLIMDGAGNIYGAASRGGTGFGLVFKLDTSLNESILYNFTGGSDASGPLASLIMDAAGNLYGTASSLFALGFGSAFKLAGQTPQQKTQAIIDSVNALFAQGVLNKGQDNSMVKTLQQALDLINAGKNDGAIENLNSFISEVNDLESSGILSPAQAASLISAAQSVIAQLS